MEDLNERYKGHGVELSIGGRVVNSFAEDGSVIPDFSDVERTRLFIASEIQSIINKMQGFSREEIIEAISERVLAIQKEFEYKRQRTVMIVGGRGSGKATMFAALAELKHKISQPYWEDECAQEQPMTSKQSMLRGRPDLLKEDWRRKGRKR